MKPGKVLPYALVGLAVVAFLHQRRRPIPLPPRLSFLLENPVTEHFVGADLLVERLDLAPGMSVLDAGCGPGRLTIPLARAVGEEGRVVALDSQRAMLDRLEGRLDALNLSNVRPVEAGLGEGALERNYFDRAVLAMVLGEVRDRASALREIRAALKPGGILSITEVVGDPDYHRPSTVRRKVEAAGLRLVARYGGFPAYTLNFEKPLAAE
ncbi:MAG TPA: methyltransferase domain-containing protein [Rubrobacteraceae bacterium]|nr:methyltransferase domain-containing protein [Rubrobacteraceae bacterium]